MTVAPCRVIPMGRREVAAMEAAGRRLLDAEARAVAAGATWVPFPINSDPAAGSSAARRSVVDEVKTATAERPAPLLEEIPLEAEVLEETALATRATSALLVQLQKFEQGEQILVRRKQLYETARTFAIQLTSPADWVLSRARPEDEPTAMLKSSGAQKMKSFLGIELHNVRPLKGGLFAPERVDYQSGAYGYRGACDAYSATLGNWILSLEGARRNDEDFTGRAVDKEGALTRKADDRVGALDSDLRMAVRTLLETKAVRVLGGFTRVPESELTAAWKTTGKTTAGCVKGHGFGTSSDRGASKLTPDQVKEQATALGNEVLRRVGGDKGAAASLLRELTSDEEKGFKGFESVGRISYDWQIEKAWRKLRAHATFGDQKAGATEKGEKGGAREPGQDG
jgi:hypothetical protein